MNIFLFDIDGTLLASGGAGKAALETALTEDFGVVLRDEVPYAGRTDRAIQRDLFHLHDIPETEANRRRLQAGYLRRLPGFLRSHCGRVLPGILALLEILAGRDDASVGLLTGNLREGADVKLGHFGLREHFGFGGFGDHHLDRDDVAREALAAVRSHVGSDLAAERIWVIGDTPLDVRCGRCIGAKVLAVATGGHTVEELTAAAPDLVLPDLADPMPFLDLWS